MKLMKRLAHSATNKKMLRQPSLRSAMTARNCRRTAGCTSAFPRAEKNARVYLASAIGPADSRAGNRRRYKKSGLKLTNLFKYSTSLFYSLCISRSGGFLVIGHREGV